LQKTRRHWPGNFVCLLFVLLLPLHFYAAECCAEDKNGVSPNTVSLPSGPGSIEGLGEAFQPMLNTGTARYAVKISLPPGTNGHTPQLSLSYESGLGDGPAGIGWTFGPVGVKRQTDLGIPRYVDGPNGIDDDHDGETDEADETDRFIGVEGEELVQLGDGTFRARVEGAFVRYRRVGDHWEAHLKDGTRLEFGLTAQSRVSDEPGSRVFEWLLEKSTDTNGNVIEYSYAGFDGFDNRKYLKEIRWGPGAPAWNVFYFVSFHYEDRPDWRQDYRSGFPIRTAKRLRQIDVGIQGILPSQCAPGDWNDDGSTDALIRRYSLSYTETYTHSSFLSSVTRYGSDGETPLPPLSFSYSLFSPETSVSAANDIITSPDAPAIVMDSQLVELVDLNRDGLPDILKTNLDSGGHTAYTNLGMASEGDSRKILWDKGHDVQSPDGLAQQLHLADKEVHLADMDGDGLADLVHTPYSQEVLYYLNEGDGSWSGRKRMSILDTAPPAPFTRDDARTADLDFDKRMDVVMSTEEGYRVWFNLKEGTYSSEAHTAGAVYGGQVIQFSQPGVYLADMNGDRMSDVVRIRPSSVIFAANMGHGSFDHAVEIPIPDTALTDGANGQVGRARLEDINGDGLDDLVVERAEGTDLWYWLNRGNDSFSEKHVITDMPDLFATTTATRWADLNGNGTTDLVYADSTAASRLRIIDIGLLIGGTAHPNLLTGIDNGLGVHTEITYKSSTEYEQEARQGGRPWSSTIPFPVSVIARVRTATGLDLDGAPGPDEYVKGFSYRDGFYEDWRKAFRGFAEVTVTEIGDAAAPTSITTHQLFTGGPDGADNDGDLQVDEVSDDRYRDREEDALKGVVRSVAVRSEGGVLFSEEKNDWQVRNLAVSDDDIEVRFAYNEKTEKHIYEGMDTPETTRTTFTYDDCGNVTANKKYGALSITGDESFAFTEYINDTNLWILGVVKRQYITDAEGQTYSETLSYYDGEDYTGLPFGQLSKGKLTRQQGWVEGSTYINSVRSAYDSYGNITGAKDGNGNLRTVAWDNVFHAYPIQENIEVGSGKPDLSIAVDYNLGLGGVTRSIDFNDNQTHYQYDRFGRLTNIIRPGDSSQFPTQSFAYAMTDPAKGLLYSYDNEGNLTLQTGIISPSSVSTSARETSGQAGTFDAIQYVDGLGRKLALVEEGETGFIVKEAVLFNTKGTARFGFFPFEKATAAYASPSLTMPALETRYDATGRPLLTINPADKDGVITQAAIEYLPLAKTVTDENNIPKSFFQDGLERLVKVHEENNGETYVTRYANDPTNVLVRITDAQDNVKTFEYDGLSRKTALNDPDRGRMEYTYDAAGNLVQTVDNKGQAVVYTYDGANRMLSEDYLDAAGITPDVSFFYDAPSADYPDALNLKGELSWVEDLSGGQFFSYDNRGNTDKIIRRIKNNSSYRDFSTAFSHDAMGRVESMTYPDGEQVSYVYNNRTLLGAVPGFIEHIDYHPSGQTAAIAYANGVTTNYAYDPRQRLTDLNTVSTLQGNAVLQDLGYSMDGVSNITAIADGRALPLDLPKNATQSFQYDDLYRLTRAQGPGYGAIDFAYDKIGNMAFKSSPLAPDPQHMDDSLINLGTMSSGGTAGTSGRGVKLPGEQPGPHALTGTESGLVYDYDDNGNMTSHANGDLYTWDFKDRLARVHKGEAETEYTYDHSGQRVIKKVREGGLEKTTLYISEAFEIREGKDEKYVFADNRRVAQVETDDPYSQTIDFQPGWNFFALDLEPEDPAVAAVLADIAGSYAEIWTYDAETQEYEGYVPANAVADLTELHAQKGYLIKVDAPVTLTVTGTLVAADIDLSTGWNLAPCPPIAQKPFPEALAAIAGLYGADWGYDTAADRWKSFMPEGPDFLNTLGSLQPAVAYWIKMRESAAMSGQGQDGQTPTVHFYHPDHLGSSNVVTDANGSVVENTEFYPFGRPRYEERSGFDSAYKFTGKELDKESGLMYYEARYLDPLIGRFASVDPLAAALPSSGLSASQSLNYYAYTQNNPVKYIDPDGCIIRIAQGTDMDRALTLLKELTGREMQVDKKGNVVFKNNQATGFQKSIELVQNLISSEKTATLNMEEFEARNIKMAKGYNRVQQAPGFINLRRAAGWFFGRGADTNVYVTPSSKEFKIETKKGMEERPLYMALGHELIHALRIMRGEAILTGGKFGNPEEQATIGFGDNWKELWKNTSPITENLLREEHNLVERVSHAGSE